MWLKKYKSNASVIGKIKILKTFSCLGLGIPTIEVKRLRKKLIKKPWSLTFQYM